MVKEIIKKTKDTVNFIDKNRLWEYFKCEFRSKRILYARERAQENAKIEKKIKRSTRDHSRKLKRFKLFRIFTVKG